MLSFLLKQIWIGIDYFLSNFFATFGSVLGLQITVTFRSVLGLRVNSGLQPPTCWADLLQAHCCVALSQPKKEPNWRFSPQ